MKSRECSGQRYRSTPKAIQKLKPTEVGRTHRQRFEQLPDGTEGTQTVKPDGTTEEIDGVRTALRCGATERERTAIEQLS
jgi:hypothetical protein